MKKYYFLGLFCFVLATSFAQVGVNTTTPNAMLEIRTSNEAAPTPTDGLLIPKVNVFPATNPTVAQQGMLVYLTTLVGTNQPGFYFWDFATLAWRPIAGATAAGTLDQAYDFGGAGLGRTITADNGAVLINGTDGLVSTGTINAGAIAPSGFGTKMFWNPRKAAIRAGGVNGAQWDDANIGTYSTAFGNGVTASAFTSTAFGNRTTASGFTSTAFGTDTGASGTFSTAFGAGTIASGGASTAFGQTTTASGGASTAFGEGTSAFGRVSSAFGAFTQAIGDFSTAFGRQNSSRSYGETALGIGATTYVPSINGDTQFRTANATDRLFVIGNAIDANNNNIVDAAEQSDAMVVLKNGSTGIGASNPEGILDVSSSNKGILIPRIALTSAIVQAPVSNPQGGNVSTSTLIYNTATNGVSPNNVYPGFYYWNGTKWIRFDVNGENNPKYYTAVGTTNANSPPIGGLTLIPEMQITLTPNDSTVLVNFSAAGFNPSGACGQRAIFFQIVLDGVAVKGWQTSVEDIISLTNRPIWDTTINYPINVTPGIPHTIQVLWYFPSCNGASINNVANPIPVAAGATYQAYRSLTIIDPNGGGGIVGSAPITTNMWSQNGNAGTNAASNFVGTVDNQPLVFRSNNFEVFRIATNGNLGLGTITPLEKLHIVGNIRMVDGNQGVGQIMTSDVNGRATWQNASANAWGLTGNSGTNATINFIGTTDNIDVIFRRNSLISGRIGVTNTSFGLNAFDSNTSGTANTATGFSALTANTIGVNNTANGYNSLSGNTIGFNNTAVGFEALLSNVDGDNNTAVGVLALQDNTIGIDNTAIGRNALLENISGNDNTATGRSSLRANTSGNSNTAFGRDALFNSTGSNNTAVGRGTLSGVTTGTNNTAIGFNAQVANATASNQVRVGSAAVTLASVQVGWTITSDNRWKSNIEPSNLGLEFVKQLNPVFYTRKDVEIKDGKTTVLQTTTNPITEYGFIAQELESTLNKFDASNNGIISKDDDGMYGVRYNDLIAPLVKAIQEQQAIIEALKVRIEKLENK